MIYLIGGPPKCGKSTLTKKLAKKLKISWVGGDTLQVVARAYMNKKDALEKFPWSAVRSQTKRDNDLAYGKYSAKEVVKAYTTQAKAVYDAVDMFIACEIGDCNDYIIEGYQIEPAFVSKMYKKYGAKNLKAVFLIKKDVNKFVEDCKKSTTGNDWILKNTKKKETFVKIAQMISEYGDFFEKEANRYGFKVFNMDTEFQKKLSAAENYLK